MSFDHWIGVLRRCSSHTDRRPIPFFFSTQTNFSLCFVNEFNWPKRRSATSNKDSFWTIDISPRKNLFIEREIFLHGKKIFSSFNVHKQILPKENQTMANSSTRPKKRHDQLSNKKEKINSTNKNQREKAKDTHTHTHEQFLILCN